MCMTCMTGAEAMLLNGAGLTALGRVCLLYTSPSPRD